jgi:hypothetical protein
VETIADVYGHLFPEANDLIMGQLPTNANATTM